MRPSPIRRTLLRGFLTVAVVATVLPLGATPAHAATNNAVQLDGTDDGITLGPAGSLGASQFTLELWFKRTGTGLTASTGTGGATSIVPLISKGRSEADGTTQDTNYILGISTITGTGGGTVANSLAADFEDRTLASNNNNPVFGTTVITQNAWHHAAATFNGSQFCLYLDGVLDGTCRATTLVPTADSVQIPAVGTAYDSLNNTAGRFAGQVDEVRIWSTARTQAQIQASMNQELTSGTGLIGRWGLNEGSGTSAASSVGSTATLVGGATWVFGAPVGTLAATNNAVQLDGTDDGITLGPAGSLGASQFTLELWFKRTGTGLTASTGTGGATSIVPLISKGRSEADGTTQDTNYILGISTITGTGGGTVANSLAADFEDRTLASNNNNPVFGTTVITQNAWHHAAATFNGSQFCLYLDGVLDGTCRATTLVPTADSVQIPAVGTAYDSLNNTAGRFAGQVDEVRIWSTARTQAQIQSSMNVEIVSQMNGLIGRWGMNEGAGTSAANSAGSAPLNGTLVGGGTWAAGAPPVEAPPAAGNYGVQLDGVDDQIDLGPASATALGAAQFTLELWFKKTGAGIPAQTSGSPPGLTSVVPLITKGRSEADATTQDINYFFGIDASGKLAADFEEGATGATPGANHGFIANTVVTSNVWHHAAVTYDGSVFRIYLDGALDGTSPGINQPPRSDSAHKVGIGVAYQSPTASNAPLGAFAGQLDEVRIWNVARTQAQIQSAMGSEITTGQAGLLGRLGLNEGFWLNAGGTGTTVSGTLVNGPTWVAGTTFTPPNTAPVVDSVTIEHATPRTNDTLSVSVTSHDAESNPVTYAYQWTKNGVDIAGATSATLNLATAGNGDKGDEIRLRVTASDASLTSAPLTSSPVTILNTAPTATVSLDDHAPGTNATLTATATRNDADGDTVTLTYVWTVNGTTRQTTAATSSLTDTFDLSLANHGGNGDAIEVSVTPNDGTVDGTAATDSATVGNAAPVVDSVVIDQGSPLTDDTLSATVTAHDADNDPLTTSYQWTRNGEDIAGATDATLDLSEAGNGDRGDLIRVRVTVSDGSATSAPATSDPVAIANTAPTATVALDDDAPGTGATLTATATADDADGDGVTLTYLWTVDGVSRQTTVTTELTDTFDLSVAGNGDNGDLVVVTVTPNDGTANGSSAADSATVGNGAPVVDSVTIDQATPRTDATLSATVTSHDPDGDDLTYAYQWTRNGTNIDGATGATLDLAVAGNGDRDDLIRVGVTASDGSTTSVPLTSDPVTVLNTAPTATVSLDDHSPSTSATLIATATDADADDDAIDLTYVWTVNGSQVRTTTTSSLTDSLDLSIAGNGDNGELVVVTVTPDDGTDAGDPATDSATVGNEAPVVDSVVIDQATPRTDDLLSATATAHDPDGGTPTLAYQWTRNGDDIAGATTATLDLSVTGHGDRDDAIRVRVTASDGSATSAPLTSDPVTVLNTAPTATVSLDEHAPTTNGTLTATATRNDADGNAVSLTYLWTVNGSTVRTTTTTDLTDNLNLATPGHGDDGQTIVVTVTPNDGTDDGSAASDTAIVGNSTPIVDSVVIEQGAPRTNDVLTASASGHDPDGSPVDLDYQWTRNGSDIAGETAATLDLSVAGNGDEGDTIRVRATASDGSTTSAPLTSSPVTILNSNPTATVSLDDHDPGTSVTLTATATRADADGDTVTLTYVWTVNGVTRQTTTNSSSLTSTFDLSVAGNGSNGDTVVVTVTPNDGSANGSAASDTATVGNGAPVVTSAVIDQASPRTNDTLSVTVVASDPDGPAPTLAYQWTRNGTEIAGATTPTLNLATGGNGDEGDAIRVRVTASDGSATSAPSTSAPVTILNTAPTATVSLNDHAPGTNATLTATATRADADADTVTLTYVWTVNGVTRQTTSNSSSLTSTFDLSVAGNGDAGDAIVVTVTPNDGTANGASATDSASISGGGAPPVFVEDFANLSAWTVTRFTLDNAAGSPAAPSARAAVTNQSAFGNRDLTTAMPQACLSLNVSLSNNTSNTVDLFRLRSANNGALIKVYVATNGQLFIRSDFAGSQQSSGVALGAGFHNVELCGTVGTTTSWTLYRDGQQAGPAFTVSTGTAPIARVQLGDNAAKTFTANFDHVVLDQAPGEGGPPADTTPPTQPGQPTGSSPSAGTIQISWTASTDASPPITYRIYRDGNPTSIGQTTSLTFMDPGLTPGTSHTYTVDAVDAVPNPPSTMSQASASILVSGPPADTTPPTQPGQPTGSSPSAGTIQISWTASTDASPPITYRIYRDGNPTSIGQTTSLTFMDPGLTPGTSHTYTVDAVDAVPNPPSTMSQASASILVSGPPADTTPPTQPGQPTGSSPSAGTIQISWTASTDASPPITYRIYRDGNPTSIGQTTSLTFMDPGLTPGTSHTYTVDAVDAVPNAPGAMSQASASILVSGGPPPAIFSDDFANLGGWTAATRITIDNTTGSPAVPSGRAAVTALPAFAYRDLTGTFTQVCFSVNVSLSNNATNAVDLFRLRTAANGAVSRALVSTTGILQFRSDVTGTVVSSGVVLGTGFHNVELCGTVGTSASWTLYRDGNPILTVPTANTGTTPIGRVQIGDTAAKTFTANFDHVVLDQAPGEGGGPPADTTPPTQPGQPSGSSPSAGTIQISWTASTDASPPITYRIYRDGNPTAIGQTTSLTFMDPGLTPGTSHTYTVDAVDAVPNAPSQMSQASASILVSGPPADTTPPTQPGQPTGSSPSAGMIQISWTASTDASPPITYRIYRDGNPTSIGQTTSLTFMDPGLTPGTSHTYTVDAVDAVPNPPSAMSQASASILVSGAPPAIFSDDFANLAGWTSVTRITIDNTTGSPAAPSGRAAVTNLSAFAYRDLASPVNQACFSLNVSLSNNGTNAVDLFRLRGTGNTAMIRVYAAANGILFIRSDFSGQQASSNTALGTGFHNVELCGTVGTNTTWTLYRDGNPIGTLSSSTGTVPLARVQIGDNAAKTFTANFDNARLDQVAG